MPPEISTGQISPGQISTGQASTVPAPAAGAELARNAAHPADRIFVGRSLEIGQIGRALLQGSNVVIRGRAGIGKRALLAQVRASIADQRTCLYAGTGTPKQFAADLAAQIDATVGLAVPERLVPPRFRAAAASSGTVPFRHVQRTLSRQPIADQLGVLVASLAHKQDVILFLDSLEVPPTLADMISALTEHCQLCAAMEDTNRRARIDRLLWRVQVQMDLKPLPQEHTRAWAETWLQTHPITFDSPRVRSAFVRAVVRDSAGIPAAVQGMLELMLVRRHVTRDTLRDLGHEAAVTYLDMTPVLVILSVSFMALRYVSRGMGMKELMVLAGVGTSMFYLLLYFTRFMAAKRR